MLQTYKIMPFQSQILLFLVLVSCGRNNRNKDEDDKKPDFSPYQSIENWPILSDSPPVRFDAQDPSCMVSQTFLNLSQTFITALMPSGQFAPLESEVSENVNWSTQESTKTQSIQDTFFGHQFVRECEKYKNTQMRCKKDGKPSSYSARVAEKKMRLCKNNFSYARNSIERVAVQSLSAIGKVEQNIRNSKILSIDSIPKVSLYLLPEFITQLPDQSKTLYIVSNLAYFPQFLKNQPTIMVFPQNQNLFDNKVSPLWFSSFTVAHEYGHHLQTVFQKSVNYSIFRKGKIFSAVSEAFADLVSFVSIGEKNTEVDLISCIGPKRNPSKILFPNGTYKSWDSSSSYAFFNGDSHSTTVFMEQTTASACDTPDYRDPHDFGAVLSAGVYLIMKDLFAKNPGSKIDFIFSWYEKILNSNFQNLSDQESLEEIILAAEKVAIGMLKSNNMVVNLENYCRERKNIFPFLSPRQGSVSVCLKN